MFSQRLQNIFQSFINIGTVSGGPYKGYLTIYESLKNSYLKKVFVYTMHKKIFQSKGSPIQKETTLGLKLVYSFINFLIRVPATYITCSKRNCGKLQKCMVKQIQRFVRYFGKKIVEVLLR